MPLSSACALCAALALAPSPSPSPAAAPPEIAHVYTADRVQTTVRNTARTTYVITRDQIARNGYRTIAQALLDVPALQISPFGPIGSTVDFSLRGSNSAQVLVLVDGLPAPGSFSNSVELGNLPTTGVDRIEVVEGGGSTLYGTGAVGGIINIITQRSSSAGAMLRYGSFADRELQVEADHVQFSRIVAQNDFGLPGGAMRPDVDYESTALHLDAERSIGSVDALFRAGMQSDHLGAPGPDGMFVSPTSRESDVNEDANLMLSRKTSHSETTLQFGGTTQQIAFACSRSDPNCAFANPALNTEGRVVFDARNDVHAAENDLLYGIDLSRGTVRSDTGGTATPPISTAAMAQTAAYVQDRFQGRSGMAYVGARGERDGGLGGELSPSAGFILRLSDAAALKGNLATAFRAPNATELYFPGYGNPDLHAERSKVADVALLDSRVLGGLSFEWFGNRTNHLIVPEPVPALGPACVVDPSSFTYEPCNVDHALIEGLTLGVRTLAQNGFVTSLNMTDLYRAQDLDTHARLPNDPVLAATLRLDYTARGPGVLAAFGAAVRAAGKRGDVVRVAPFYDQADPYTNLDAYVRWRAGDELLLTLRGFNLGNERYAAVNGYPLPGRSFALELSTKNP